MPNWAEQLTALSTAVLAFGAMGAVFAAGLAWHQLREVRIGRQAEVASELFRRWSDDSMIETRRLVASYESPEALRNALTQHVEHNEAAAYVMFRELDFFEQLGALEAYGAISIELVRAMLGERLVDRWELWSPAIDAIGGPAIYPMFKQIADKMRTDGSTATVRA
jgi:hypothetical protein